MNSSYLMSLLGLEWLDPAYIWILYLVLFLVLLVLHFVQMAKFRAIREKYETFMEGKEEKSLESQFDSLFSDISDLKQSGRKDRRDIDYLLKTIQGCYQKVGLVKYDAFHEMGGKLSFALCMLDKDDNGFIMNSVHSNTGCYTYTKEIVDGQSAIDLGEEEREALEQAVSNSNSKDHHDRVISEASRRVGQSMGNAKER